MFVAFCDQVEGNSTSRCSKAGSAGSPMTASRISHSTQSKGCLPGSVKRRGTLTPAPLAVTLGAAALRLSDMTSPRVGANFAGTTDDPLGLGWNGALDGELVLARERVVLEAPDDGLELVEMGEVSVDGGELDRRHGVEPGEPALGEIADLARLDLRARAPHRRRDRLRQSLQLLRAHGPLVGGPLEPSQELPAVESLAAAVTLEDGHVRLRPLVRGEAVAAAVALATAADGIARIARVHDG